METTLNGTMPNINAEAVVNMNSFKEIYRREDRGRVESDGAVTFEVNGQAIDFSVLQRIDYDELKGCDTDFYSFDVESKVLMSRYDAGQKYSAVAIRSFIVNASSSEGEKR